MPEFIIPDWPAPANVHALVTTRQGGVSAPPWDSFNLGDHVDDQPEAVAENRRHLRLHLPSDPLWLQQVHGTCCVDASTTGRGATADAAFSRQPETVCAILTADCLPVLLCDDAGTVVAAAHAGWRGLAAGVIESAVANMALPGERLLAWLGPAIGPQHFEVGPEVRDCFMAQDRQAAAAFVARPDGKWQCDIYLLARQRLNAVGINRITSVDFCTFRDSSHFYSYRRDGITGRMASLIWRD